MRRLDRYFLSVFLPACVGAVGLLVTLFLIVDVMLRRRDFDRLRQVNALAFAAEFYAVRVPLILYTVLPLVPLTAGAFTVIKMARSGEILPVVVGGTSLRRLIAPVVVAAGVCAAGIAAIEEWVMPPLATRLAATEAILSERERSRYVVESDDRGNYFYASEYDHVRHQMQGYVEWLAVDAQGRVAWRGDAMQANWQESPAGWRLLHGRILEYEEGRRRLIQDGGGRPRVAEREIPEEGFVVESTLAPYMIREGGEWANRFVTFEQAMTELRLRREIPFHWVRVLTKLVFPLAPLLLVAAGLPLVMGPEERSFLRGVTVAFLLGVVFILATIGGQDLANRALVPAWLGVCGPSAVFAALGVWGALRLRT